MLKYVIILTNIKFHGRENNEKTKKWGKNICKEK